MINIRLYKQDASYHTELNDNLLPLPSVSYAEDSNIVYYNNDKEPSAPDTPEEKVEKTVKDLIDEGYAVVYGAPTEYDDLGLGGTSSKGNRIRILNTCPYEFSQITDIQDVALNNKQIYSDENGTPIDNIIVWNNKENYAGYGEIYQGLPSGFSDEEVIGLYNHKTINFQPQAILFSNVDFESDKNFELTFAKGGSWMAIGQGIFRGASLDKDDSITPENIKITLQENFSSVFQRMFQHCHNAKRIEISGQTLSIQASGLFEYDYNLEEIIFNCDFNWNDGNLVKSTNNMFHSCNNLRVIPLKASLEPTEANREAQTFNATQGECYDQLFCYCKSLTAIMPVLDFTNVTISDLTNHLGTFTSCNVLSDIRIKNLGNCNWDFVTIDGAALPAMDTASINYLLNNVSDVTEEGGYELRLPQLHQAEVDASAIANATAKGWDVQFGDPVYVRSFDGWVANTNALGDYDFDERQLTIRSFKPNTWLIKYTPEVAEGETMNQAIYNYLYGFNTKITGIEEQTGDETMPISWYKTNNDAGGYFCRGILLGPFNSWDSCCVTAYPWEMGVPNGSFKNPNNGAHYYGYTKDGNIDLYTYNSTHTYPENSGAYAGLAIYTGTQVGSDGYITLNNPITIKLY